MTDPINLYLTDSVTLHVVTFQMGKWLFTLALAKPRYSAEAG
jgi:hypothetical protein